MISPRLCQMGGTYLQSPRAWRIDNDASVHRKQVSADVRFLRHLISFVSKEQLATLQRNDLIVSGNHYVKMTISKF
jgi:hypothetical protein